MGATLLAILAGALLLPGIIATQSFFRSARTAAVDPPLPALTSSEGVALVGGFSVVVHALFVSGLAGLHLFAPLIALPWADPYIFAEARLAAMSGNAAAFALFWGLFWLCGVAVLIGALAGRLCLRWGKHAILYGPLSQVYLQGNAPRRFITAYVLTKVSHEGKVLGYEGIVESLAHDAGRYPAQVILRDAESFTLDFSAVVPVRAKAGIRIDWIVLNREEWANIAFSVYELADD
ncbi:hypothetical protein [Novosphingobium sp. Chol11]|uniref:hypothetical protein n=1 Tax=Novosphingobium sp. Chol11 TaxID=1385763 RepID=UPI0025FADA54|nr:hypothetical protein [Novosphingobium sp. Chol11]